VRTRQKAAAPKTAALHLKLTALACNFSDVQCCVQRRLISGFTFPRAKLDNKQDSKDRRPDYGQNSGFRFPNKSAYGVVFLVSVWSMNHDLGVLNIELEASRLT